MLLGGFFPQSRGTQESPSSHTGILCPCFWNCCVPRSSACHTSPCCLTFALLNCVEEKQLEQWEMVQTWEMLLGLPISHFQVMSFGVRNCPTADSCCCDRGGGGWAGKETKRRGFGRTPSKGRANLAVVSPTPGSHSLLSSFPIATKASVLPFPPVSLGRDPGEEASFLFLLNGILQSRMYCSSAPKKSPLSCFQRTQSLCAADVGLIEEVHLLGGVSCGKLDGNVLIHFLIPNMW